MDFKLDHFRLYDVQPYFSGATPTLNGQFDGADRPAVVGTLRQLANPVSKDGEAIKDQNSHFTIYDAQTTFPDPIQLAIFQPAALAVPSLKLDWGLAGKP